MKIESLKLELISWISELDDEVLLKKINSFRSKSKNNWESLSYEDRQAIDEGLSQLDEGQFVPYSEVRKKIKSKLNQ